MILVRLAIRIRLSPSWLYKILPDRTSINAADSACVDIGGTAANAENGTVNDVNKIKAALNILIFLMVSSYEAFQKRKSGCVSICTSICFSEKVMSNVLETVIPDHDQAFCHPQGPVTSAKAKTDGLPDRHVRPFSAAKPCD
jgi:hypothetical protein